MSESPESTSKSVPSAPPAAPPPYWLYRFAAWVGIIAGIVFIVSSVFFAGVYVSKGGHHCHHHRHHHSMSHHGHHKGPGPTAPGSDNPGPGELPQSVTPSPAPAGR
ncbi:MAG: hypothetical protein ABI307_11790 [Mycobacterium sp.]